MCRSGSISIHRCVRRAGLQFDPLFHRCCTSAGAGVSHPQQQRQQQHQHRLPNSVAFMLQPVKLTVCPEKSSCCVIMVLICFVLLVFVIRLVLFVIFIHFVLHI